KPSGNEGFSDNADWDRFVTDPAGGTGLDRLTGQIQRAVERRRAGEKLALQQVLDLEVSVLPDLDDSAGPLEKAWALLRACGCNGDTLQRSVFDLLAAADFLSAMDPTLKNLTALFRKRVRARLDRFYDNNRFYGQGVPPREPTP